MAWKHRQIGMFALQGLHSGHLIHADGTFSLFRPFLSQKIEATSLMDLLLSLRIGHFCEPVAKPVRLEAPISRRRAACRGEICSTMPRSFSSSAISRPVHWLIVRPSFAGASQAIAAI